jgi:23S rRNA (pseudouridine1915-N3)-methyltransferase
LYGKGNIPMRFTFSIIAIGKKNDTLDKEVLRYQELIGPFATITPVLLKPPGGALGADEKDLIVREGELLQSKWPPGALTVALSEEGTSRTSKEFSRWLFSHLQTNRRIVFTIGGAYGLSPDVKRQCKEVVSLSPMTLPHKLCMLVLIEQIYRAFTILHHHPYHK